MSDNYKVVNGTSYHKETPDDLIALLEKLRTSGERVILLYGDIKTGIPWETYGRFDRGRIGRSMGASKIPLLIRTRRSLGGEGILDHCIVQIRESSKNGKFLYRLPFHLPS